jgi:hypothetical protein
MKNQIDKIAVVENDFAGNGFIPFPTGKQIHAIDENNMDWNGLKPPFQLINDYVRGCTYKGSLFLLSILIVSKINLMFKLILNE